MQLHNSRFAITLCTITLIYLIIIKIANHNKGLYSIAKIHKLNMFTKEYQTYGNNNTNYLFYDPRTFGIDLFNDSCKIMSTRNFRRYLNSNMRCIGKWCHRESYKCLRGNNRDCYNVEHIIDKKSPEFPNCNKNILANYVMTWGAWNQNLGRIARWDYNSSTKEKELVYGSYIMNRIRHQMTNCCL